MNSWISIFTFTFATVGSAFVVFTALQVTIAFCVQKLISDYHIFSTLQFWISVLIQKSVPIQISKRTWEFLSMIIRQCSFFAQKSGLKTKESINKIFWPHLYYLRGSNFADQYLIKSIRYYFKIGDLSWMLKQKFKSWKDSNA